jgi:hypothetical protein
MSYLIFSDAQCGPCKSLKDGKEVCRMSGFNINESKIFFGV